MSAPYYAIAASVPPGNRILHFRSSTSHGAADILTSIPRFRWAGFDLAIPGSPVPGPGDSLELRSGDRKLLRLYQDGTLLFGCRADHEFLGWGAEPDIFERFPRLNPVQVTEVHASFVHVYREVLMRLAQPAPHVTFKLSLRNGVWNGQRLFLTRYVATKMIDWGAVTRYPLEVDPAEIEVRVASDEVTERTNRAAYRLLAAFVSWFDMPEDEMAFTSASSDGRQIDLEAIKALHPG